MHARFALQPSQAATVAGLMLQVMSLATDAAPAIEAGGYHPSRIKLSLPGIEQAEPRSYQQIVHNKVFWIFPPVTQATVETAQFLQYLRVAEHESVLDVGTGSGVLAVFAALQGQRVLATDIDSLAIENARYNIVQHGLQDKIELRQSDLFDALRPDEVFDVVLFNVGDPGLNNAATFWQLHERFLSRVKQHLTPTGRVYSHSGYVKYIGRMQQLAEKYGLKVIELHMWTANLASREPVLFVLTPRPVENKKPPKKPPPTAPQN